MAQDEEKEIVVICCVCIMKLLETILSDTKELVSNDLSSDQTFAVKYFMGFIMICLHMTLKYINMYVYCIYCDVMDGILDFIEVKNFS